MKERSLKQRLVSAVLALVMMIGALVSTTYAWFTDSVTSAGNKIVSGSLKVDLELLDKESGEWISLKDSHDPIFDYDNWEPGYIDAKVLKVENEGSLALKWKAKFVAEEELSILADVIDVYVKAFGVLADDSTVAYPADRALEGYTKVGTLKEFVNTVEETTYGNLLAGQAAYLGIALKMQESAGNDYQRKELGEFDIQIVATQLTSESDSFGDDYDKDAAFPDMKDYDVVVEVPVENGAVSETTTEGNVTVPAGVKVNTNKLGATVKEKTASESNVTPGENEIMRPLDVHVEGVAEDNEVALIIALGEVMPKGLNIGNYTLYHLEDGVNKTMTAVADKAQLDAHNEFYYDPVTGEVWVAMATFSEVAILAETDSAWKGNFDYSWYDASKTELTIANADQLAAFGAIVGGMAEGIEQDSFSGKTVKLIADINLGDDEKNNNPDIIFYPIGYYSSDKKYEKTGVAVTTGFYTFCGTFDGNGNTIANFYQNTWEMKGDNEYYAASEQRFRDGMGLFGRLYKATVKNLTVKNFSSDGEYTTTGTIAAYAEGTTFENIAIFECNPRVYNIGNGGIVGCVGWYAKEAGLKTTFKNITVDNSNKISALWGSWDVACGGIVGQYYPTSGQSSAGKPANGGMHFENCHVAAQIDVYNDVCANYQYYAYRYAGILIGSVRENVTIDGHSYPKMDDITAKDCTVHFGDWNDYYYCELVANSLASYTHDHQMSRLTQIEKINVDTMKYLPLGAEDVDKNWVEIPTSGRVNYVVVKAKDTNGMWSHGDGHNYAECYHFVNGAQHFHDKADADNPEIYETVNGVNVLKEDKQLVYREFNNLVTGYGWGVTSKGVGDLKGVTILDREVADSVDKFKPVEDVSNFTTGATVTIGDLFKVDDDSVEIKAQALQVTVSPVGNESTVGGTFTANTGDWTKGTLTFTGVGKAKVTITDYYFCNLATIEVTVVEREPAEKFAFVFPNTDKYLYRVGNEGAVSLGTLFKYNSAFDIVGAISVTIEEVDSTSVSGTYSGQQTWTDGTIKFDGTGIVKVTIKDEDDYCIPTELYLEVVDAKNATSETNATANNVVLLNNAGFSSLEVKNGYTFYGNGFTLTAGEDRAAKNMSYGFVQLENGTLDNVQIKCPDFAHAILFSKNADDNANPTDGDGRYYNIRSAVVADKNSRILNSYISGGRAAVYASSGTLLIENSTIEGGAAANIHVASCDVTLRDVTLIQEPKQATTNGKNTPASGTVLMGFSVFVECDTTGRSKTVTLEGTLNQYAWVNKNYENYVPEDGKKFVSQVLQEEDYIQKVNGEDSLNLGFVFMADGTTAALEPVSNGMIVDNRTNKDDLPYGAVRVNSIPYVYSCKKISGDNLVLSKPEYVPNAQAPTAPKISFSDTNDARTFETLFDTTENRWSSILRVDVDQAIYAFSFEKLLAQKYGKNLTYTVTLLDGSVVDKNATIELNDSVVKEYILTIVDDQMYDSDGQANDKVGTSMYLFKIVATKTSIQSPQWVSGNLTDGLDLVVGDDPSSDWQAAVSVLDGLSVKYWSKAEGKEKTLEFSTITFSKEGKQNATNNSITIKVDNEYTLVITTSGFKDNPKDSGMPVVVRNNGKQILYFTAASSGNYVSRNTDSRTITITYTFTDANNTESLTKVISKKLYHNNVKANEYSDFCNGTLKEATSDSCFVEGTLITMADGTQKRVEDLVVGDMVMIFNHVTGQYEAMPLIFNTHADVNEAKNYDVLYLQFADGRELKIVQSHGLFDTTLMQYVYINYDNYQDYIGHEFYSMTEDGIGERVELVNAFIKNECVRIFCPVTYFHMNSFANGFLNTPNIPGDITGLVNYFEYDEDLKYNEEAMQRDIETYGLYTYEDFSEYISEAAYNSSPSVYLKVAVGKGMITYEQIVDIINWLLEGSLIA